MSMKPQYMLLAFVLAAGTVCFGQRARTIGSASGSSGISAAAGRAISLGSVTNVQGELQNQIDVKKAQPGDPVVLKTTRAIKQNGETILPKGSNLIGHVTQVSQQGKGQAGSSIGILFDRLQGDGMSAPITASILSITNTKAAANAGDSVMGDVSGSSTTSGSASGGGGGLLGGVGGAATPVLGIATQSVGGVAGMATQTVGAGTSTGSQTVGSTAAGLGRTVNGIQISNSVGGSASGGTTLSAAGKDLKLEKGITFQLQLSSAAGN